MSRLSRTLLAVCVVAALCAPARPSRVASGAAPADGQTQLPTLKSSNILYAVKRRKSQDPRPSPSALARYANELLARQGFDYDFNACEFFPPESFTQGGLRPDGTWTQTTFEHRLTRADGREAAFKLVADDRGGMCAECFLTLPALRVTKGEMTLVGDGTTYSLKRPASFVLDEVQLLDSAMKRVLRTWHLPYQSVPSAVSPDGRSIYLDFYEGSGLAELVLEISEDGRPRFRVRSETVTGEGEWITDPPREPHDAFEGYMRFRAGGRNHVIRFTGPCT